MKRMLVMLLLLLLVIMASYAEGGLLDDIDELEGKVITAAGEVEKLDCPISGKYDCLSWPMNLLKFKYKDICFETNIIACGRFCKGFIAVGKDKIPYFFVVEGFSNNFKKYSVKYYECPDMY